MSHNHLDLFVHLTFFETHCAAQELWPELLSLNQLPIFEVNSSIEDNLTQQYVEAQGL